MEMITPNWKVPKNIRAYSSTRLGGVSVGMYQGLNLGMHVADDPIMVEKNRQLLHTEVSLPSPQVWLNQTHSDIVIEIGASTSKVLDADGMFTSASNVVCTVMTADCLPVLLTDIEGSKVAAVHAGWRGLANGILEKAVNKFDKPVVAWLGPAIGAKVFEVGQDVLDIFVNHSNDIKKTNDAFFDKGNGKYLADINQLAEQSLFNAGVENVYKSDLCTFENPQKFYSYRRDGITGRQATFIWIEPV